MTEDKSGEVLESMVDRMVEFANDVREKVEGYTMDIMYDKDRRQIRDFAKQLRVDPQDYLQRYNEGVKLS